MIEVRIINTTFDRYQPAIDKQAKQTFTNNVMIAMDNSTILDIAMSESLLATESRSTIVHDYIDTLTDLQQTYPDRMSVELAIISAQVLVDEFNACSTGMEMYDLVIELSALVFSAFANMTLAAEHLDYVLCQVVHPIPTTIESTNRMTAATVITMMSLDAFITGNQLVVDDIPVHLLDALTQN